MAGALDQAPTERIVSADGIPDWNDAALEHLAVLRRVARVSDREAPRFVVLIGVDGTGKSTQAEFLESDATAKGLRVTALWTRWEPRFIRPLMSLAKHSAGSSSAAGTHARVMSRKRRIFRSPVVRYLWKWLAGIDYGVQIVPRVRAAQRGADLVIADRYFHDALVDMGANFGGAAPSASGPFRLFPKPDRVVLLDAPEEVVFARKQDVPSLDYLRERRPLYLDMAHRNGWPVVDASRPVDQVRADIAAAVWGRS
jgi:thymidylate kinase